MDFVAIDFETANSARDSACSLGAVIIKDDKIVARRYSLINPCVEFHRFCTSVHGITARSVAQSPKFEDIYPSLFAILNKRAVYAHNASFDMAVLQASCEARGLTMPEIEPYCSVEMARKAWPELKHHRLDSLCEHFSIPLIHHNAAEDATACAMLVVRASKQFNANSPKQLVEILDAKARRDKAAKARQDDELARKLEIAKAELRR